MTPLNILNLLTSKGAILGVHYHLYSYDDDGSFAVTINDISNARPHLATYPLSGENLGISDPGSVLIMHDLLSCNWLRINDSDNLMEVKPDRLASGIFEVDKLIFHTVLGRMYEMRESKVGREVPLALTEDAQKDTRFMMSDKWLLKWDVLRTSMSLLDKEHGDVFIFSMKEGRWENVESNQNQGTVPPTNTRVS